MLAAGNCGCTSMLHNAVPVMRVPPHLLAPPTGDKLPIDFALLGQKPTKEHVIGPDDILGIHIPKVTSGETEPPPVHFPQSESVLSRPAVGQPVRVGADGTIILPLIPPLPVAGLTIPQARAALHKAYAIDRNILNPETERVIISLIRPRTHRVLVLREDPGGNFPTLGRRDAIVFSRRGSAHLLELPVGENDLLHALTASGGLPGVDARNEVWILRNDPAKAADLQPLADSFNAGQDPPTLEELQQTAKKSVFIPLRLYPDETVPFSEADVLLHTGDVVVIESRETEHFFTGGLLGGGQIPLPRDYDLDVIGAIALANGSAGGPVQGSAAASNFRGGTGSVVPPTRVIVVRTTPSGDQFKIHVDVKRAFDHPEERLIIQPGDIVALHYTPAEFTANLLLNFVDFRYVFPN
jgi:protein involved in polysaccharide export with SLBB domain